MWVLRRQVDVGPCKIWVYHCRGEMSEHDSHADIFHADIYPGYLDAINAAWQDHAYVWEAVEIGGGFKS